MEYSLKLDNRSFSKDKMFEKKVQFIFTKN